MVKRVMFLSVLIITSAGQERAVAQRIVQTPLGVFEVTGQPEDPESGYRIRFPGQPIEVATDEWLDPTMKTKELVYAEQVAEEYVRYSFHLNFERIMDPAGRIHGDPKTAIEIIHANVLKKPGGWVLLEDRMLPEPGFYQAWSWAQEGKTFYVRTLAYLRSGRLYTAVVSASNRDLAYGSRATQFLDSLRFPKTAREVQLELAKSPLPPISQWHRFVGPENDFSLSFPREPWRGPQVEGGVAPLRIFKSVYDSYVFSIILNDLGGDPGSRAGNAFASNHEQFVTDHLKKRGIRVVWARRVAPNLVEDERWAPNGERNGYLHSMGRSLLFRGRLYQLGCGRVVNDLEVDKKVCQRFFSSLRLMTRQLSRRSRLVR
ncbi:MAG TPA: hypothetical protein VJ302_27400 [Blastocatellia bacterium]|nr:hypothetical protein [Blastocatellia bacterium]